MQGVWINIFKMLFSYVSLNAFRMKIFRTVGGWTFGYFIFLFHFRSDLLLLNFLFSFSLFGFLVLNSIVASFLFANKTSNQIVSAIITSKVQFLTCLGFTQRKLGSTPRLFSYIQNGKLFYKSFYNDKYTLDFRTKSITSSTFLLFSVN